MEGGHIHEYFALQTKGPHTCFSRGLQSLNAQQIKISLFDFFIDNQIKYSVWVIIDGFELVLQNWHALWKFFGVFLRPACVKCNQVNWRKLCNTNFNAKHPTQKIKNKLCSDELKFSYNHDLGITFNIIQLKRTDEF